MIGGGYANRTSGSWSAVVGGIENWASGQNPGFDIEAVAIAGLALEQERSSSEIGVGVWGQGVGILGESKGNGEMSITGSSEAAMLGGMALKGDK